MNQPDIISENRNGSSIQPTAKMFSRYSTQTPPAPMTSVSTFLISPARPGRPTTPRPLSGVANRLTMFWLQNSSSRFTEIS